MPRRVIENLVEEGANLLARRNRKLSLELRQREADLKKLNCNNSEIGRWIRKFELSVLLELLSSTDEYFQKRSPFNKSLTIEQRVALIEEIKSHITSCKFCDLKIKHDNLWKEQVDDTFTQFRKLPNETTEEPTEPEHRQEIILRVPA